jgi:hypothetical protein
MSIVNVELRGSEKLARRKLPAPIVLPLTDGTDTVLVYLCQEVERTISLVKLLTPAEPPLPKACDKFIDLIVVAALALAQKEKVTV